MKKTFRQVKGETEGGEGESGGGGEGEKRETKIKQEFLFESEFCDNDLMVYCQCQKYNPRGSGYVSKLQRRLRQPGDLDPA